MSKPSRLLLSEQAYQEIRRRIIECDLRPGAAVSEPALSEQLGVGRAGVRAALTRLSQERLVRPVARQGYVVSPLTIEDVRNLLELRLVLEPHAARSAAGRISVDEFQPVLEEFRKGYNSSDPRSLSSFLAANRQARLLIARTGGNERLVGIIAGIVDELERYLRIGLIPHNRSRIFHEGLESLVATLASGDAEASAELCRAQIEVSSQMILEALYSQSSILKQELVPQI
ncbi:MAG: GntR family transcriptional regulator [Pigmentiphaga sp.]|nr:GntR family transcriptional regulator [Pigmentiphaga sp.]